MKSFDEFDYERIDPDDYRATIEKKVNRLTNASTPDQQLNVFHDVNQLRDRAHTMMAIARTRHAIDTTEDRWEEEQSFYDEAGPVFTQADISFYRALLDSSFRNTLEKRIGEYFFELAELEVRTFDPSIKEQRRKENRLSSEYQKLLASCRIQFRGEDRNLSGLRPFMESPDRDTRKNATAARWSFFNENASELDNLYDNLVQVRHGMADDLGYDSYVELAYDRLGRTDYGPDDVAGLRDLVAEHVVPVAAELKERQRERIGVDELKLYDEPCQFPDGNPEPSGPPEWIIQQARTMYRERSDETDDFIREMMERDLMDLENRNGKAGGGFCTFFPTFGAPFIFSNFNGTADDVRVLTHEGGHAFNKYLCRDLDVPEYRSPTPDTAEIHSMSMEFLTWPWMKLFFEEDTDRFLYQHLARAIRFLPYGCAVDEFQQRVYRNPNATPAERHEIWREIEDTYLPERDPSDFAFTDKGGYWQSQRHIYRYPFYYIDYVLARICALQFWSRQQRDVDETWNDYVRICKTSGSKSFLDIVREGNIDSPFEPEWVSTVLEEATNWLDEAEPE